MDGWDGLAGPGHAAQQAVGFTLPPAPPLLAPQVYPATKVDASKLIDILAPIRCGLVLPAGGLAGPHQSTRLARLQPSPAPALHIAPAPHPPTCHTHPPSRDKDPREDLKTLARMYCTGLEMQMRDKARCVWAWGVGGGAWYHGPAAGGSHPLSLPCTTPLPHPTHTRSLVHHLHPCSAMVATREEYAGLPPKKRPARAAASKGGKPAASEGSKPKDAPAAAKEGGAKADAGKAGEARRTSDSSKGPSLPPGLGAARGGRREEPARERERRRDERADGPPPGRWGGWWWAAGLLSASAACLPALGMLTKVGLQSAPCPVLQALARTSSSTQAAPPTCGAAASSPPLPAAALSGGAASAAAPVTTARRGRAPALKRRAVSSVTSSRLAAQSGMAAAPSGAPCAPMRRPLRRARVAPASAAAARAPQRMRQQRASARQSGRAATSRPPGLAASSSGSAAAASALPAMPRQPLVRAARTRQLLRAGTSAQRAASGLRAAVRRSARGWQQMLAVLGVSGAARPAPPAASGSGAERAGTAATSSATRVGAGWGLRRGVGCSPAPVSCMVSSLAPASPCFLPACLFSLSRPWIQAQARRGGAAAGGVL